MLTPDVIKNVVDKDMCVGCGICTSVCDNDSLKIGFNTNGFLVPKNHNFSCDADGNCLKVCPFNPFVEESINSENKLSELFIESKHNNDRIGSFHNLYAGHSFEYRNNSSSGGMATYVSAKLFELGFVDHVISVKEIDSKESSPYEFKIQSSIKEIQASSKTRYYPVSYSDIFKKIKNMNGKFLVVGTACFIKAIRLLQNHDPFYKSKIPFLVGIICGGLKSKFYSDFLAENTNTSYNDYIKPQYRIKNINSTAGNYNFGCLSKSANTFSQIEMKSLGDMWGTGLFKCNACDYCDDVTTELADISLGDAWVEPYVSDGKGNNIVITRSNLADKLILDGIKSKELNIENLSLEDLLQSQSGSFSHRQDSIDFRLKSFNRSMLKSKFRFRSHRISLSYKIVQFFRRITRKKSLKLWIKYKDLTIFNKKMRPYLLVLSFATKVNHKLKK